MPYKKYDPKVDELREGMRKNPLTGTRFYFLYYKIRERCNNKNHKSWMSYGGKGVRCEWNSFEDFRKDMHTSYLLHVKHFGEKETTIDRVNPDGNYSKENCRWATWKEQWHNMKITKKYEIDGQVKSTSEWSEIYKIPKDVVRGRINLGWSIVDAFTMPVGGPKYRNRKKVSLEVTND